MIIEAGAMLDHLARTTFKDTALLATQKEMQSFDNRNDYCKQ
jgi:hypothetical protein